MIWPVLSVAAVLSSGPFSVTPSRCPQCPYRMRFSADGRQGFVNLSRVGEAGYSRMAERAFVLMKRAADGAREGEAIRPIGSGWRAPGVSETNAIISCVSRAMETNGLQTAEDLRANPFLRAMDREIPGKPCEIVQRDATSLVLVRDADGGPARDLAIYNADARPRDFTIDLRKLRLNGDVEVFDLSDRADIGVHREKLSLRVPPLTVRFLRLEAELAVRRAQSRPNLI